MSIVPPKSPKGESDEPQFLSERRIRGDDGNRRMIVLRGGIVIFFGRYRELPSFEWELLDVLIAERANGDLLTQHRFLDDSIRIDPREIVIRATLAEKRRSYGKRSAPKPKGNR